MGIFALIQLQPLGSRVVTERITRGVLK